MPGERWIEWRPEFMMALWPIQPFKSRGYDKNRRWLGRSRIIRASLPPRSPVCALRFFGDATQVRPSRPLLQTDRRLLFGVFDPTHQSSRFGRSPFARGKRIGTQ